MWRGTQGPQNLTQGPEVSGKKIVYGAQVLLFYVPHPKGGEWNNVMDHELSKLMYMCEGYCSWCVCVCVCVCVCMC